MTYTTLKNVSEYHGTKAMNLSVLINNHFNVPKGFGLNTIFTSKVFDNQYSLDDKDHDMLQSLFDEFEGPIVVRSSGLLEDLSGESFAGQYDTVLNITTYEDFTSAIIQCIKSSFSEHAKSYGLKKASVDTEPIGLIVQEMVEGHISGVLFTANPITGNRNEMMITSALGHGFGVVDGTSEIEKVVLNKADIISRESNVHEDKLKSHLSRTQLLTDELCKKLMTLGLSIQSLMKAPQDIEWVIKDDELYMLQTRDITTLYPIESEHLNRNKLHVYLCYNSMVQGITMPYTPLGYEFWRCTFAGYSSIYYNHKNKDMHPQWIRYIHGRIYYDLTEILGRRFLGPKSISMFDAKDPEGGKLLKEMYKANRTTIRKQGGRFKLTYGIVKWGLSLSKYGKISRKDTTAALKEVKQIGFDYISKLEDRIQSTSTINESIQLFEEVAEELLTLAFQQIMYINYGLKAMDKWEKWLDKHLPNDLTPLKLALPNNPTTEMGLDIMTISMALESPHKDHPLIKEFIRKYGHRSHVDTDLGVKRWHEDTDQIIQMIHHYKEDEKDKKAYAHHLKQVDDANALLNELYLKIKNHHSKKKADQFKFDMNNYRTLVGLREWPKFIAVKAMSLLREMLINIGQIFVDKGYLLKKDDVAFLLLDEIKNIDTLDAIKLVAKREAVYLHQCDSHKIPRIILSNGEVYYHSLLQKTSDGLKGVPLSAGKVKGTVKILHAPFEKKINSDEILVTHNTDPTWTPLFPTIKGLIMESGGPISHGAIVAREYGLAAIGGVSNALNLLKDGDVIEMDGRTGKLSS